MDMDSESNNMSDHLEGFFKSELGRSPSLPFPPKDASVETWDKFAGELERLDPRAFDTILTVLKLGFHILEVPAEGGGEKE